MYKINRLFFALMILTMAVTLTSAQDEDTTTGEEGDEGSTTPDQEATTMEPISQEALEEELIAKGVPEEFVA